MQKFDIIDKFDNMYKYKNPIKERNLTILEFNERIMNIAKRNDIPILERLNFINISFNNIDEFISEKLVHCNNIDKSKYIKYIEKLYSEMEEITVNILQKYDISIGGVIDNTYERSPYFKDKGLYYVYIDGDNNFNIVLFDISKTVTEEKIRIQNPLINIRFSFIVRFICNKSFTHISTSDNIETTINEMKSLIKLKNDVVFNYIQSTCSNEYIMSNFINQLGLNLDGYIYTTDISIQLPSLIKRIKLANNDLSLKYADFISEYKEYDYIEYLKDNDILIHNPYESYSHITDFIHQMCISEDIKSIGMTLYRTADNSIIIKSLIKAKLLGKSVSVYIEPTAKGNEENNIENIEKLLAYNIEVSCNYYSYKVHSKIFYAIDKDERIYAHIGTGNYNEDTSKVYTDIHLLTTNKSISYPLVELFDSLMKKKMYTNKTNTTNLYTSPIHLREHILLSISKEIIKGNKGKIFIKCNSLCDLELIDRLYAAAKAGVKVRLIVRTSCSIIPIKNIEIRSKIGRFLEHSRIYIFGDDVYISSADLLLRNINKRVEVMCKIITSDIKLKVIDIFINVWNDIHTQYMGNDYKWHQYNEI